jgi:hypothetical protein
MFLVQGMISEKLMGKTAVAKCKRKIFIPLGMSQF